MPPTPKELAQELSKKEKEVKALLTQASGTFEEERRAARQALAGGGSAARIPEFPGAGSLRRAADFAALRDAVDDFTLAAQSAALSVNGTRCFTRTLAKTKKVSEWFRRNEAVLR